MKDPYRVYDDTPPSPYSHLRRWQKWVMALGGVLVIWSLLQVVDYAHHEPAEREAHQFVHVLYPEWREVRIYCQDIRWDLSRDFCTVTYLSPTGQRESETLYCRYDGCSRY